MMLPNVRRERGLSSFAQESCHSFRHSEWKYKPKISHISKLSFKALLFLWSAFLTVTKKKKYTIYWVFGILKLNTESKLVKWNWMLSVSHAWHIWMMMMTLESMGKPKAIIENLFVQLVWYTFKFSRKLSSGRVHTPIDTWNVHQKKSRFFMRTCIL